MPECIFTSKRWQQATIRWALALASSSGLLFPAFALAQDGPPAAAGEDEEFNESGNDRTLQPEDEDFGETPYTDYGEFNEDADEATDTKFFQQGRLFGVSLGAGMEGATGNRSKLWQGGLPAVTVKLHYWFDFNVALDLTYYTVRHYHDIAAVNGYTNIGIDFLGGHLRYYFDTKDAAAAITFANPYVLIGAGQITKAESILAESTTVDRKEALAVGAGLGLEFPIKAKKSYVNLEAKIYNVNFTTDATSDYSAADKGGLENLDGALYTVTVGLLFTW